MTDSRSRAPKDLPRTVLSQGVQLPVFRLAARYLKEYEEKILYCTGRLSEDEIWWCPGPDNPASGLNSVGNLLLHLKGNLSLWILSGVGGYRIERDRAGEFSAYRSLTRKPLEEDLSMAVRRSVEVLERLDPNALEVPLKIQGYDTDALGATFHAVEHMSYHTGQIVLLTKQLLGARTHLEFYPQHADE
ncbi:MAG: DUF1572 family protein [Acidobacteriota bacterium]